MNEKTINELNIGDKASFTKTILETDVIDYTGITGDFNPLYINNTYAKNTFFDWRIVQSMLSNN